TVINGTTPGTIAEVAREWGALLIHYSTDYVFDGAKATPYSEEDATRPLNAYGRSKLAGERAIAEVGASYLILRTSWVYTARGNNFLRRILRLASEQDELRIVADQVGAPTWAPDIADTTASIIRRARQEIERGAFVSGIFHLTAAGATSRAGFAQAIV